jgi:lysophospholipase L1-like esterase
VAIVVILDWAVRTKEFFVRSSSSISHSVLPLLAFLLCCAGKSEEAAEPLQMRVLAGGDSITYGAMGNYYGYRGFLVDLASTAGMRLVMVGGETENVGVGEGHEAHPGWRSDEVQAAMQGWLDRFHPDVVLLHVGTNDLFQNLPATHASTAIDATLELIRRGAPQTWTIVATPGPFRSPKDAQCAELAALIRGMVSTRAAQGQKVLLADARAAFEASPAGLPALLEDSAHPKDLGYYLMARSFFEALRQTRLNP